MWSRPVRGPTRHRGPRRRRPGHTGEVATLAEDELHDLVVLGGGPAGYGAALCAVAILAASAVQVLLAH